jgi:hypothetical protein
MPDRPTSGHPVWQSTELDFDAAHRHADPYTGVEFWCDFVDESGMTLRRPGFWAGGSRWRVRFSAPTPGRWRWTSEANVNDPGLAGRTGTLDIHAASDEAIGRFHRCGFWRMSPLGRSLVHADGTPALLVADTAWAMPWRATTDQVRVYADDRSGKGFNAVLLMTVQPDMKAVGPRVRGADEGFDVGFEDLPSGHLNDLNVDYFDYLDDIVNILRGRDIVPVLQPVFFGFGWKGLDVAGPVVPPPEYARFCRYLVARYGAGPTIYLVGADGTGREPQVAAGGAEVHAWDCYGQPTGVHYRPHADNAAHQDADWLDFQWCQTGHTAEHVPERVADMWRNLPVKAVANGEPTYEATRSLNTAGGWWQGHEAWSNLCAGGTMGVVYGAASLWQWVLRPGEPGMSDYFLGPGLDWRSALGLEGSAHVGRVGRILEGLPTTDMRPGWQDILHPRCLVTDGRLVIAYAADGGPVTLLSNTAQPMAYRVIDPRTGELVRQGRRTGPLDPVPDPGGAPRVYLCTDD